LQTSYLAISCRPTTRLQPLLTLAFLLRVARVSRCLGGKYFLLPLLVAAAANAAKGVTAVWLRPSSQQTSPTPYLTLTERLYSFYFDSSRDTRTTTPANKVSSVLPTLIPPKEEIDAPLCPPGDFSCFSPTHAPGFLFADAKLQKLKVFWRAANPSNKKTQDGVPKRRPNSAIFVALAPLS